MTDRFIEIIEGKVPGYVGAIICVAAAALIVTSLIRLTLAL